MEAALATALRDIINKVGYVNHVSLHVDNAQVAQYTSAQNAIKDTISSIIDVFLNVLMDISRIYNPCLVINVQLLAKHAQIFPTVKHVRLAILSIQFHNSVKLFLIVYQI